MCGKYVSRLYFINNGLVCSNVKFFMALCC